ncbi:MAG: endonuclease/exonuclease/phosphatase family protein [Deltaproteobacteria bacterium]|nr:endonuclease/exonuclease/phosphatase family protein [Deltaproteobacteria bacterium]
MPCPLPRPLLALVLTAPLACGDASDGGSGGGSDDGSGATTDGSGTSHADGSSSEGGDGSGSTGGPVVPLGPWRVMSFNVMCSGCTPAGYEPWSARVPHLGDTVRRHDPDLLGTQELFAAAEVAQIEAELPEYTSIWWAAPDADSLDYADAAIFYRSAMFEEVEHGFYWLSPDPDEPYSNGFAAPQLPRLVVWARLRVLADGAEFVFATTHFDNNAPSQEKSAPLVLSRTAALATDWPVVMVGDFNAQPTDPAYAILTTGVDAAPPRFDDAFVLADDWRVDTNLTPAPAYDPSERIDHVFVAGGPWRARDWVADLWGYGPDDQYTSDHFAIAVELSLE